MPPLEEVTSGTQFFCAVCVDVFDHVLGTDEFLESSDSVVSIVLWSRPHIKIERCSVVRDEGGSIAMSREFKFVAKNDVVSSDDVSKLLRNVLVKLIVLILLVGRSVGRDFRSVRMRSHTSVWVVLGLAGIARVAEWVFWIVI